MGIPYDCDCTIQIQYNTRSEHSTNKKALSSFYIRDEVTHAIMRYIQFTGAYATVKTQLRNGALVMNWP